jgi:hypothetical protein
MVPSRQGLSGWVAVAVAFWPLAPAWAQSPAVAVVAPAEESRFQPGALQWGDEPGWRLTPGLTLAAGWSDNLRLSATSRLKSPYSTWTPGLTLQAPEAANRTFTATLQGELTRRSQSPADNANNGELTLDGAHLLDPQTALAWKLAAQDWHDIVAPPVPGQPPTTADHFRALALGGVLRHDWAEAPAWRTEAEWSHATKRYLNHRDLTWVADVHTQQWLLRGLRAVAPGVRTGVEWRESLARYPASLLGLDNIDQRWQAVALWEPVAEGAPDDLRDFSLSLRLGVQHKGYQPDLGVQRAPWKGVTWALEGNVPVTAAQSLSVGWAREASDAPADGVDHLLQTRAQWAWSLAWSAQTRWTLSGSAVQGLYQRGLWPRKDRSRGVELGWQHDLTRQCQLGAQWGWARRHSSQPSDEFVRHQNQVSITLAL